MTVPRYPQLSIDIASDEADHAAGLLFDLGAQGIEERDRTTLAAGAESDKVTLVATFETREDAEGAAAQIDPSWHPRVSEIVGDAWRDEWKKHFTPFQLTARVTIRPPWETVSRPTDVVLELEPGRAFGTGLHATTALVARALEAHAGSYVGKEMLDVGTGSGILALVGLALGAARVRAVDVDPEAVAVAIENATRNGLESRLLADTSPLSAVQGAYAIVTANIEAKVLVPMAGDLATRVSPDGILVLSGILDTQEQAVRDAFGALSLIESVREGEWVALVLRQPG